MTRPREHDWLERFVGEWAFEIDADATPDGPDGRHTGTETVRALGGGWIVCDGRGEVPGTGSVSSMMTLGFDPAKGRCVGSFVTSMMTHLWVYEGALDADGGTMTLETEGPGMSDDGTTARYRDVIELRSPDHRTMTSSVLGEDGTWRRFMTADYRRTK